MSKQLKESEIEEKADNDARSDMNYSPITLKFAGGLGIFFSLTGCIIRITEHYRIEGGGSPINKPALMGWWEIVIMFFVANALFQLGQHMQNRNKELLENGYMDLDKEGRKAAKKAWNEANGYLPK